jgi:hypothetical protein
MAETDTETDQVSDDDWAAAMGEQATAEAKAKPAEHLPADFGGRRQGGRSRTST